MDNKGETVLGALSVVSFGLILCLFLRRTGNLWCAVGFHLGYDWGQTFLYGVPNSGLQPTQNFLSSVLSGPRWLTGWQCGSGSQHLLPHRVGHRGDSLQPEIPRSAIPAGRFLTEKLDRGFPRISFG